MVPEPSASPKPRLHDRIPTLDGWRGVAVVAVLLSHMQLADPSGAHSPLFAHGRLGVDLFFAISGYLICTLLLRERDATGAVSLRDFFARRFFRIVPLCLVYLATLLVFSTSFGLAVEGRALLLSSVFLRNLEPVTFDAYTNHLWSLAVEFHFYLLFPLLLLPRLSRRTLVAILFSVGVAVRAWSWMTVNGLAAGLGGSAELLLLRTDYRMDSLAWGAIAAIGMHGRREAFLPRWLPWLVASGVVAVECFEVPMKSLFRGWAFALLVATTLNAAPGLLHRLLESAPLRWLGSRSYSIYIWQTLFLQHAALPDPAWLSTLKVPPWSWVLCLAVAELSFRFVEHPAIQWGRRWMRTAVRPVAPVPGGGPTVP